jgi:hypothetical protein
MHSSLFAFEQTYFLITLGFFLKEQRRVRSGFLTKSDSDVGFFILKKKEKKKFPFSAVLVWRFQILTAQDYLDAFHRGVRCEFSAIFSSGRLTVASDRWPAIRFQSI